MVDIKLYKPYGKQKLVHKACNDDETFFITVNAGRQAGKTMLAINQALYWALSRPKTIVYWVSPTTNQCTKVYNQIKNAMLKTDMIKSYKGSAGDTEMVFKNGSIIKFRGAAQEDSLRGESVDYLIVDESAFIKGDTINEILLPMLNVRGKKYLSISTPKGKNHFYYQVLKGKGDDNKYKSFKFTSSDNPHSNPVIIQMAKESLPEVLFNQEYLAMFVDSAAVFENIEELAVMKQIDKPVANENYFIGVDIGMKNDYTVVTVLNDKCEMVHITRFTDIEAPQLKEKLVAVFNTFKPKKIFIESNNQGQPIIDDLKQLFNVKNIVPFNTNGTTKPEIINNLINSFASKSIKVLDNDNVKSELEAFTMTLGPTGKPKFAAPSGFHDDIPMSLAIALEAFNKGKFSGSYNFISV
jgi:hypothetical protein